MAVPQTFLLDANVFIQAKRRWYRFAVVPGFWDWLAGPYKQGTIRSIDRVMKELEAGKDDLRHWAKKKAPKGFFEPTIDDSTAGEYGKILVWVQEQPQCPQSEFDRFAAGADGWLVAHAKAEGYAVVTHEEPAGGGKRVKIPDVCRAFKVEYTDTFDMLEGLKAVFTWGAGGAK